MLARDVEDVLNYILITHPYLYNKSINKEL